MRSPNPWVGVVVVFYGVVAISAAAGQARTTGSRVPVPDSCPVTVPSDPLFSPPAPYPVQAPSAGRFWYGTVGLWTMLKADGVWSGVPPTEGYRRGYRDKVFWWRPGYDGRTEQRPKLTVSGKRLDGDAPRLFVSAATNAHVEDFGGWTMLTALDIPTTGCWELTGSYLAETLTFVVWVVP
ncbi:MAG: hypothetical protein ACRDFA_07095 [bacterium]